MSEVRQGDVYWFDFGPIAGSGPAGTHPCVVVQNDVFNKSLIGTSVVCLITTNLNRVNSPGNVRLAKREANLKKPSIVNVSQIWTVDKSELTELIGVLNPASLSAVRQGLRLLL